VVNSIESGPLRATLQVPTGSLRATIMLIWPSVKMSFTPGLEPAELEEVASAENLQLF